MNNSLKSVLAEKSELFTDPFLQNVYKVPAPVLTHAVSTCYPRVEQGAHKQIERRVPTSPDVITKLAQSLSLAQLPMLAPTRALAALGVRSGAVRSLSTAPWTKTLNEPLKTSDPELHALMEAEKARQVS